ncbi:hypothetical protein E4U33_007993 [Claviceps sp. LM78 group G4]|nr:hypothetical protein E4U33_007993 [Claviceps sp. LM78 group G4]
MARPEDDFVAEDQPLETQDKKEVKSLPDDADEGNFDEIVAKDPELSESFFHALKHDGEGADVYGLRVECRLICGLSEKDMTEGIDKSNIIKETTRGAKPEQGGYKEPSDDVSDLVDE